MSFKTLALAAIISAISISAHSQQLTNKETLQVNDSIALHVGNDILINKPSSHDFAYIWKVDAKNNKTSKNTVDNHKLDYRSLKGKSDLEIFNNVVSKDTADKIKSIAGQKMRIVRFEKVGSVKSEKKFYAIVADKEKKSYKIDVVAAINSKEILIIK